jgi:hypothetical protein
MRNLNGEDDVVERIHCRQLQGIVRQGGIHIVFGILILFTHKKNIIDFWTQEEDPYY